MKIKTFIAFIMMMSPVAGIFAQTLDQAGEAFNQGIQYTNDGKYAEAVSSYEQALKISTQLGEEGVDLQLKAEQQLPLAYFNEAKALFDEKKYTEALPFFEKSVEYADKMGETKTGDASKAYLAGIYTAVGNSELKKNDLDAAIDKYNKALSFNPEYYKAYYYLGVAYLKQNKLPEMKENLDKAISMAGDDAKTAGNAKDAATSAYQKAGALALQGNKFSEAVEYLNMSNDYTNTEPRTYYYLAIAYNGLSKWDDAIEAAKKAIELTPDDKSDIYFELGKSYENKGDNTEACTNYKKVTGGNNVPAAKYQMEQVLKCN